MTSTIKTFSDLYNVWSEYYFKSLNHDSSIRTVASAYSYCSGLYDMPLKNIGSGHIKDAMNTGFISLRMDGQHKGEKRFASVGTKERIKSMCNLMFDYAVEHRLLVHNPAREFKIGNILQEIEKNAKKKEPFTPERVAELWKYYEEIPFADMVLIAIYTGFRPQKVALLEVKKVFLDENKLVGEMKTLNGIDREVPIHPDIKPLIEKRYDQAVNRFHSDMLFNDARGQQGTRMTNDKYRGKFDNVMKEMRFGGFTPHCTRHTFATQAKRCGMDDGIRKRIMGHSLKGDLTESVYTHPTFEDLTVELNKLSFPMPV